MSRLSTVLGAPIHQDTGDPTDLASSAFEATITAVDGDRVSLIVPGFSGAHDFIDIRYCAPAGTPAVDDPVVAVFTDDREPIAIGFGAGGGLAGTAHTYTVTNASTDRAYDANATTLDELADVLGTLVADLRARGVVA